LFRALSHLCVPVLFYAVPCCPVSFRAASICSMCSLPCCAVLFCSGVYGACSALVFYLIVLCCGFRVLRCVLLCSAIICLVFLSFAPPLSVVTDCYILLCYILLSSVLFSHVLWCAILCCFCAALLSLFILLCCDEFRYDLLAVFPYALICFLAFAVCSVVFCCSLLGLDLWRLFSVLS
jgi:hypothetical protein